METVAVLPSATSTEIVITPKPTSTPAALTPTFTPTQIPCDPLSADFCIRDGTFLFQPPILPPDNDSVDGTYRYGSTQNGARDPHHGVEFQNRFGTPVYAAGDGLVVFAESDISTKFSPWTNFYGNMVLIRHAGGFYTLYAHFSNIFVEAGNEVKAGDRIGEVGQTGGATGSHLHFEVRKGGDGTEYFSTENPELWLIPQEGTGTLSVTLKMDIERNFERPLVVTRLQDGSAAPLFIYYLSSYTKGFEHNDEDAVLGSLPPGRYKVAFSDGSGLRERIVLVEAGKLTQVVFEKK
jgi:murein DD-endopeptidase MepM/ murein hydrolase activator NlpD